MSGCVSRVAGKSSSTEQHHAPRAIFLAPAIYAVKIRITNQTRDTELASAADLANTSATRRTGLLKRESLEPGEGLLIVPCESVHTFFMKFPIDLVYLDKKRKVLKVRHAVPAWRMSACLRAHSVLELPAGTARKTSTVPGDVLAVDNV